MAREIRTRCNRVAAYLAPNGFQCCPACRATLDLAEPPIAWEPLAAGACDNPIGPPVQVELGQTTVGAGDLSVGDVIEGTPGPYGDATVKQVEGDFITLFRCYVAASDFTYTGGIICTVGIEEYKIPRSNMLRYRLKEFGNPENRPRAKP